jgi:hypothetical protein
VVRSVVTLEIDPDKNRARNIKSVILALLLSKERGASIIESTKSIVIHKIVDNIPINNGRKTKKRSKNKS